LIFQVQDHHLHALGAISTDQSPEGVAVNSDGTKIAVANYDGQSIQLFDTQTGEDLWTKKIGLGHGVCIVGDRVYGTDLSASAILELDLYSGSELRRVGAKGLDETQFESLWPTYISPYNDQLLIADGLGGMIYIVDRETLQPVRVFGHNGPSDKYLMMPYCAIGSGDMIIVGSEAQDRIVVMKDTSDGLHAAKSLNRYPAEWDYFRFRIDRTPSSALPIVRGHAWEFPTCVECWDVSMFGATYKAGFRILARVSDFDPAASRAYPDGLPLKLYLANPRGGLYSDDFLFTTTLPTEKGYLFVSSRQEIATYFSTVNGIPYYVPARVERGSWVIDGEVWGPTTFGFTQDLIATLDNCVSRLASQRSPNGYVSLRQLRESFFYHRYDVIDLIADRGGSSFEDGFQTIVSLNFESAAGRAFFEKYLSFTDQTPASEISDAAKTYYKDILSLDVIRLPEFALVSTLTGYAN
jgi:hypothetical protein